VGDIDFLRRRIHLHRNAVTVGGTLMVGTLKTGEARTVSVPVFVLEALSATCADKGREELIWPSASGGYLAPPGSSSSWLSGAVARCQAADATFPRITAHALAHRRIGGHLGGGQCQGGATDARALVGGHEVGCLRRSVR
jgi:integrase